VNRTAASLGSALFLVLAPGTVAGVIPWAISRWQAGPAWRDLEPTRGLGWLLILAALALLLDCFGRFAWEGSGAPAPIAPPGRLVVTGPYRRVRNPMYVAVTGLVLGQALVLASFPLLVYAVFIWGAFHGFVVGYEEPRLRRRFPEDSAAFFAAVPRWIPRLRPWKPG
jgi:protein-S-isoprenylcysteine O-methyltransferase Ste14